MPTLIYDFASIRKRCDEIRAGSIDIADRQSRLRELIESGSAWWPLEAVTDGADHFSLPSIPSTKACAPSAPSACGDQP
jgi:hypothetical protein